MSIAMQERRKAVLEPLNDDDFQYTIGLGIAVAADILCNEFDLAEEFRKVRKFKQYLLFDYGSMGINQRILFKHGTYSDYILSLMTLISGKIGNITTLDIIKAISAGNSMLDAGLKIAGAIQWMLS